jgi:hypothetical protein
MRLTTTERITIAIERIIIAALTVSLRLFISFHYNREDNNGCSDCTAATVRFDYNWEAFVSSEIICIDSAVEVFVGLLFQQQRREREQSVLILSLVLYLSTFSCITHVTLWYICTVPYLTLCPVLFNCIVFTTYIQIRTRYRKNGRPTWRASWSTQRIGTHGGTYGGTVGSYSLQHQMVAPVHKHHFISLVSYFAFFIHI